MAEIGCKYTRDIKILPSMVDRNEKLRLVDALDLFEDTATLHAENFDIGPAGMDARNYFWVITKIRIHADRLPKIMEPLKLNTWIQAPDRASCERDFSFTSDDEQLIYGRSIWAIISRDTKRLVHMDEIYPKVEFNVAPPDDRPFARINKNFDEAETIGEYTVRSVDIDLGGHFNNVNYVRAMLGCFSVEEIEKMDIKEMELNFIHQTFEGETLTFKSRPHVAADDAGSDSSGSSGSGRRGLEVAAVNSEGKPVFMALVL